MGSASNVGSRPHGEALQKRIFYHVKIFSWNGLHWIRHSSVDPIGIHLECRPQKRYIFFLSVCFCFDFVITWKIVKKQYLLHQIQKSAQKVYFILNFPTIPNFSTKFLPKSLKNKGNHIKKVNTTKTAKVKQNSKLNLLLLFTYLLTKIVAIYTINYWF